MVTVEFDPVRVRCFTDGLKERARRCDNGEGMICATLDAAISHYVGLCHELRTYIVSWARAIFTGETLLDQEVEKMLKAEVKELLEHAHHVAARGRAMDGACFMFQGLDLLHGQIASLEYLLKNWTTPQRSVSPAPRVKLPEGAKRESLERLKNLPRLDSAWQPTDPRQRFAYEQLRGDQPKSGPEN